MTSARLLHTLVLAGLAATACIAWAAEETGPSQAEADKARQTFQSLFGKDVAKVRGTPTAEDDVALAKRLLGVARDATDSPAFLGLLCDHVWALAAEHASGKDTAVAAMELVAEHVPDRVEEAQKRIARLREDEAPAGEDTEAEDERKGPAEPAGPDDELDALLAKIEKRKEAGALVEAAALYRKAQGLARRTGDDRLPAIKESAEALARRIRLVRRARDVRAMLDNQPENVAAREGLVRLYLVKLDDPERAAEVLEGVEDKDLKKYVPAAAKPVDEAPELACLELGEWYMGLAESAPKHAKANMYARAKAYLDRFLRLHKAKDMDRIQAKVALEKVGKALAKAEAPATAPAQPAKPEKPQKPDETAGGIEDGVIKPGKWVDLLTLADPEQHTVCGEWKRLGKTLMASSEDTLKQDDLLAFPVTVEGDYEFQVVLARLKGDDVFGFNLPVGSSRVSFGLGWFGQRGSGFFPINNKYPHDETNTGCVQPGRVEPNHKYALHVLVRCRGKMARISARLDGKPFVSWEGPQSALSTWGDWSSPRDRITLTSRGSRVVAFAARLRMLSGEARLLHAENAKGGDHGYVTTWLLAGPYTGGSPFETAYPPEKKDADVTWRVPDKGVGPQVIDLGKIFGGDNRAAYAKTYLYSPKEHDVRLELGSDDGIKVWVNGECVHANNVTRSVQPGEDKATARLHRGWNRVLVKISQNIYTWGFSFRVTASDGSPLEGMKVRLEEP